MNLHNNNDRDTDQSFAILLSEQRLSSLLLRVERTAPPLDAAFLDQLRAQSARELIASPADPVGAAGPTSNPAL